MIDQLSWYTVTNIEDFDSPCVVLFPQRIRSNIQQAISRVANVDLLRPHVKTNKIAEVCRMMMEQSIRKFKCATIAEAEMLAMIDVPDIMLAYQPVGPKTKRFLQLNERYSSSIFSCIIDDDKVAMQLSTLFSKSGRKANVFIDLNTGMNRTGANRKNVYQLVDAVATLNGINILGIHAYDGHVKEKDISVRQEKSNAGYIMVDELLTYSEKILNRKLSVVAGGSPSFATHLHRNVECSPGTFVFWDWGYQQLCPDEPYELAALVVARVISIVDENMITVDLGYKAVASESPLPRVHFLNAPGARQVMQSEEHLTLQVADSSGYYPGFVLYGVPVHICPTIALYDEVHVVEDNKIVGQWKVSARSRKLNI